MKLEQQLLTILTLSFFMIFSAASKAQVQFLLDTDPETKTYIVSMLPMTTWEYPNNRAATAQITLKAPTGAFELGEFQSLTPNVEWAMNARVNSPSEASKYDYFSFSIMTVGLESLDFVEGRPTKLFCFKNTADCSGEVSLMNNAIDPFSPPNSLNINVGNSMAVQGAGGEAYIGNVSDKPFNCDFGVKAISQQEETPSIEEQAEGWVKIFPNPSAQFINIQLSWDKTDGEKNILLYNSLGELVQFYKKFIKIGENNLLLDISDLTPNSYHLVLIEKGDRIALGSVIKIQ